MQSAHRVSLDKEEDRSWRSLSADSRFHFSLYGSSETIRALWTAGGFLKCCTGFSRARVIDHKFPKTFLRSQLVGVTRYALILFGRFLLRVCGWGLCLGLGVKGLEFV